MKYITFLCSLCLCLIYGSQDVFAAKRFSIDFGVFNRYDSNISSEYKDKRDDIISSLNIRISRKIERKKSSLALKADIVENLFWKHTELSNTSERFSLAYSRELSKYTDISVSNDFSHSYEIEDFSNALGRDEGYYSRYDNDLVLSVTHKIAKNAELLFKYVNNVYMVSSGSGTDSTGQRLRASGLYYFNSASILTVFYEAQARFYKNKDELYKQSFVSSYRYYFVPQIYINVAVGYDFLDAETSESEAQFYVSLIRDIDENNSLALSYEDIHSPQTDRDEVYKRQELSLSYSTQISERLRVNSRLYYGRGDFERLNIEDEMYGVVVAGEYEFSKKALLSLGYQYREETSNVRFREYAKNLFTMGIKIGF